MLLPSFDSVATPLRKGAGTAAGTPAATMITPSSTTGREDGHDLEWSLASSGGDSGGSSGYRSVSFSDDALLSPTSAERGFAASTSFGGSHVHPSSSAQKKVFTVSPEHHGDYGQLSGEASEPSLEFATTGRKDARSLVLLAQYKLFRARLSLELALGAAKDIASDAEGPSPRRGVPCPVSIEEDRNLHLFAGLVLTPGKTLTLSPC